MASTDIAQVAARAGVSTATVSRALRGLPGVADPTRARVLQAARDLDYVISPSASRLASGRTRTIGVVAPYIGRWFFGQVISGIEEVLREHGYDLLLYALPDKAGQGAFFAELPLRRRVDGVIILTLPLDPEELEALEALAVPLAFIGAVVPGSSSVMIDDIGGARAATSHLINLGHRRIGMIGARADEPTHFTAPDARREGYLQALRESGIEPDPRLEAEGGYTIEGGEAAMAELLGLADPPTAVFAQSDEMAFGAMRTLRRVGLSVPGDMSLVGFDDHEMARVFDLTTIAQPVSQQGCLAATRLLDLLAPGRQLEEGALALAEGEDVPTRLVIRGSTAPLRGVDGSEPSPA